MNDKFVLVRDRSPYKQSGKYPRVHVSAETYEQLVDWAIQTRLPLSELVGRTVAFAANHAVIVDD